MPAHRAAIAENVERLRERIARAAERVGRRPDEITLVAASKTFSAEDICAAYDASVRAFGENRVQEFEAKQAKLRAAGGFALSGVTWHLIGHLQSNKVRRAVDLFHRIDSIDSVALAEKLDAAAAERGKRLPILIELNLGGEKAKTGVAASDLPSAATDVERLKYLQLLGLMTIPPFSDDPEAARPYFRKLRELRESAARELGHDLPVLSMGMSHDFEVAIEEGATELRIGTAIFGERQIRR